MTKIEILITGLIFKQKKTLILLRFSILWYFFFYVCHFFSIGNEESDVECLKKAGMSGVPADACALAQKAAGYICKSSGGCGAVREFAEHIFLLLEKVNSARKQMEEVNSAREDTGGK